MKTSVRQAILMEQTIIVTFDLFVLLSLQALSMTTLAMTSVQGKPDHLKFERQEVVWLSMIKL